MPDGAVAYVSKGWGLARTPAYAVLEFGPVPPEHLAAADDAVKKGSVWVEKKQKPIRADFPSISASTLEDIEQVAKSWRLSFLNVPIEQLTLREARAAAALLLLADPNIGKTAVQCSNP